nr:immunoglobulin heavy chain junction region [Mus musculus]
CARGLYYYGSRYPFDYW